MKCRTNLMPKTSAPPAFVQTDVVPFVLRHGVPQPFVFEFPTSCLGRLSSLFLSSTTPSPGLFPLFRTSPCAPLSSSSSPFSHSSHLTSPPSLAGQPSSATLSPLDYATDELFPSLPSTQPNNMLRPERHRQLLRPNRPGLLLQLLARLLGQDGEMYPDSL